MINFSNNKSVLTICIATYNRPLGLQRLLLSVRDLKFKKSHKPEWQVVVVDNHPALTAKPIVEKIKSTFPTPIIYGSESVQGIASARNKAVSLAPECDFVAFVDDDQVVRPYWLDELLAIQNKTGADVVTGPVLPRFEGTPPDWVLNGGFINRMRYPTGTEVDYAYTNNMLIKYEWLQIIDGPFDVRMNLTGGSDTMFSAQIKKKGALIIWADEAFSEEYYPPNRTKLSWLLKRSFRYGITLATVEKWNREPLKILVLRILKGFYHVVTGIIFLIPKYISKGKIGVIRSLRKIFYGAGELISFLNIRYHEYQKR